jgi:orotate phosphoribosyltransferase
MKSEADVLAIKTTKELQNLTWQDLADREITEAEFKHIFSLCDALWVHDGNPAHPHAELTSGRCSNGFVDTLRVLRFTNICQLMAHQSMKKIEKLLDKPVDWIIGSDHAAATFSFAVASFFNVQHDFTEKGPEKTQLWKRFTIGKTETVLQVEELVATSSTVVAVREGLRRDNAESVTFVPFIFTLIDRSNVTEVEGSPIHHLVHFDIWNAEPSECPLCKAGSPRLRPKKNWQQLTNP